MIIPPLLLIEPATMKAMLLTWILTMGKEMLPRVELLEKVALITSIILVIGKFLMHFLTVVEKMKIVNLFSNLGVNSKKW